MHSGIISRVWGTWKGIFRVPTHLYLDEVHQPEKSPRTPGNALSDGIDWCCFYYFVRNSPVALLEALFATNITSFSLRAVLINSSIQWRITELIRGQRLWVIVFFTDSSACNDNAGHQHHTKFNSLPQWICAVSTIASATLLGHVSLWICCMYTSLNTLPDSHRN